MRDDLIPMVTVGSRTYRLDDGLSTKVFVGVFFVTIDRPLREKSYFNSAWFFKKDLKVILAD